MTPPNVTTRLRRLYAAYRADLSPALAALRADTVLVPGRGNPYPRYMFVGEAPGATEERLRRPFCGPSGDLLDEMLASVGWSRVDVWVTNVVKYRPPHNRDPLPAEKAASLPYLRREWRILDQPFIVTLGRHALEAILPDARIATAHGEWHYSVEFGSVLPLYHPAVALYKASRKEEMFEDFRQVLESPL